MLLTPTRRALLAALAALATVATALIPRPAAAAYVPWGTVLVPGSTWAGALASKGDLNVYSNGTGQQDQMGSYGDNYECVELAARYARVVYGDNQWSWNISGAADMWASGPKMRPIAFQQLANGGVVGPQFGDLLIFNRTSVSPWGHVAIVSGTEPGFVDIVEQNWANYAPTGTARLPIQGTTMPDRWGLPILGWLRAEGTPTGLQGSTGPGGYITDLYGGVHAYGSAAPVSAPKLWDGDMARGIVRVPGSSKGWVLSADGALVAFGGAAQKTVTGTFPEAGLARAVVLRPDNVSGYVLDAWGELHPFGGAPHPDLTDYWPNKNLARGLVLRADGVSGYIFDSYGGMHPFGGAPYLALSDYWYGLDLTRSALLNADGASGYLFDAYGGIHPFGGAPYLRMTDYWYGQYLTVAVAGSAVGRATQGYILDIFGGVHPFGAAPYVEMPYYTYGVSTARAISS